MKYFIALFLLFTQPVPGYSAATVVNDGFTALRQALAKMVPNSRPDRISPTPVSGLYEVLYGTQIFYATKDGRYMIQGDIIDVSTRGNVTASRRADARLNAINTVGEDKMIIFAPAKVKHTITVFTDVDCGYCRKFHREIDSYLKEGIRVRYMSYPRSGADTPSYYKAVSVWCAKDRKAALTRAQQDEPLAQQTCDNPVKLQMQLGDTVGVQGTPTIITDTGRLLSGYMPAAQLAQALAADGKKD